MKALGRTWTRLACIVLTVPLLLAGLALARSPHALAQPCGRDAFGKVVNDSGAALRRLSSESQPKMQAGFRKLKEKNGWREEEYVSKANALLADERGEHFDQKATELLARLDRLAEDAPGKPDSCTRLAELEATALELQATVRAKTEYMLAKLEALTGDKPAEQPVARAEPKPAPPSLPAKQLQAREQAASREPSAPKPQEKEKVPEREWSVTSTQEPTRAEQQANLQPQGNAPQSVTSVPRVDDGYTIDEIRAASKGFFGSISTSLASVIEYAFAKSGRPSAYVLGNEGGGALLAGVRYGSGTLYLRSGGTRKVYWHGPSIGYDIGAAGSKSMFLIYGLRDPDKLYSGFTGVDGSAYVVGGVGLTFLTDGKVLMAPIRSGLGLRLGANVGYVRFTPRPTWNPF
jgi:hypothetical protein